MVETDTNSPTWKFTQYVSLLSHTSFHYLTGTLLSWMSLATMSRPSRTKLGLHCKLLTCDYSTGALVTRVMSRI
jgi:hypothetical protein